MRSHAAYHILTQHVTSGKAEEYIGSLDGFCQCVDVSTVGRKVSFLFVQVCTVFRNHPFTVEHDNVFQACTESYI